MKLVANSQIAYGEGIGRGNRVSTLMTVANTVQRIETWMFDEALPFWAENSVDHNYGGFLEELTFSGHDAALPYRRTRVTCRQIYVFSHAHILGWQNCSDLIAIGADYLISKAWNGENSGFARRLTRESAPLDPTPDLYDHAFALFAFAWAYKATGDAAYKDWLNKTQDTITALFEHPSGDGFWHHLPPSAPRLQNPHMHMLEASLAAYDATGADHYKEQSRRLAQLFKSRFLQRDTRTLAEFFNDDWSVMSGETGRITEPGHMLEWIWILNKCQEVFNEDCRAEILAMIAFSEERGINPTTSAVMNSVCNDGTPIDAGSRTWPNTERLKAGIALFEMDESDGAQIAAEAADVLLERYLKSGSGISIPKGGWIDAFDGGGAPTAKTMPTSTFYHLMLAFAEYIRVMRQTAP